MPLVKINDVKEYEFDSLDGAKWVEVENPFEETTDVRVFWSRLRVTQVAVDWCDGRLGPGEIFKAQVPDGITYVWVNVTRLSDAGCYRFVQDGEV